MWWRSVVFIGVFFGLVVFIIPNLLWIVSWIAGKIFNLKINYTPFLITGVVLMLIAWLTMAYGHYVGRFRSIVNRIEYSSKEVPKSFNGYKIVHISDLHVDSFDENPEALQRILDKVNAQDADIILFTGDMTTAEMDDIPLHEKALKSLKAKEGVVSIMGNHDFFIYCPQYINNTQRCRVADRLTEYERDVLGWRVLRNESIILKRDVSGDVCTDVNTDSIVPDKCIAIAGVDNINGNQGFRTIQRGDLKKALKGLTFERNGKQQTLFTILMTHDPSHWEAEVLPKSHVQITLSGHTHAAQMRLFGLSLANLAFKECDGRYDRDGRMLYVNAGIGCTAPFRIDCPAEITVITLKSDKHQ